MVPGPRGSAVVPVCLTRGVIRSLIRCLEGLPLVLRPRQMLLMRPQSHLLPNCCLAGCPRIRLLQVDSSGSGLACVRWGSSLQVVYFFSLHGVEWKVLTEGDNERD